MSEGDKAIMFQPVSSCPRQRLYVQVSRSRTDQMVPKLMQAVQYDDYGGGAAALKHVEVPVPSPKEGEVLVKSEAISLNPVEWKMQKGVMRPLFPRKFPHIPCSDVAGEVVQVGKGVNNFKVGDKVFATLHFLSGGALAEYAVAKQNMTVERPPQVPAADAAGLPIAGITALQALIQFAGLKLDGSTANQTNLLITAASGGVGHYAVQLAKLGNTHVTATCGARNMDLVRSLGADEVLDYKTPEGAALKSPSNRKYDVVVHCATSAAPWSKLVPNLSAKGKVIDLSPGSGTFMRYAWQTVSLSKKKLVPFAGSQKGEDLEILVKLVKEGKIRTVIDSKHPLSRAKDGWAKSIDGHATGKIIIEP